MRAIALSLACALLAAGSSAAARPAHAQAAVDGELRIVRSGLALVADPAVRAARDRLIRAWSALPAAQTTSGTATLAGAADDIVWSSALTAVAQAEPGPAIVWYEAPAHRLGGVAVPSGRLGVDLPDRFYRMSGVTPKGRYVIQGRRDALPSNPDFSFEAVAGMVRTVAVVRGRDMDIAQDGSFTLTVDATPAAGRRNHLTLPPDATAILFRDTLADWDRQRPNALTIQRLDPPGARPTQAELRKAVLAQIETNAGFMIRLMARANAGNALNTLVPFLRSAEDGIAGSVGSMAFFHLADDEALVLTVDPQGGHYVNIQLCDPWLRSIPYWNRTSSLSDRQARKNADGTITFVIAPRDPGYFNWLDTGGLNDGEMTLRIEDVAKPEPRSIVRLAQVAKLGALGSVVPEGMVRVNPADRKAQLAARMAGFARRVPR